jgi:hypothetical protein
MRPLGSRVAAAVAAAALIAGAFVTAVVSPGVVIGATVLPQAWAEGEWSTEFDAVCSKTQDAMALSSDELRMLMARCDKLKPEIDALEASRRKVYAKRLQLCRDLYEFVLQSRDED